MTKYERLLEIKKSLGKLKRFMKIQLKECDFDDYSYVILPAFMTTELLIREVLIDSNIDTSEIRGSILTYALNNKFIPLECRYICDTMRYARNCAAHGGEISYEQMHVFSKSYDVFLYWFFQKYEKNFITDDINIKEYIVNLSEFSFLKKETQDVLKLIPEIYSKVNQIDKNIINISNKIDDLSCQITNYQSLMQKQLNLFEDEKDRDKLISTFVDECAEKIVNELKTADAEKERDKQQKKLILSLGETTWNKLEIKSRTFLISSKLVFDKLILDDDVDYSGVCLLVTKALEVELSKRFCDYFIMYLKNKYPGKTNYSSYPTCLLDKYGNPIKGKQFTLGTFAYLVGVKIDDLLSDSQRENNKSKLLEYLRDELLPNKTDNEILELMQYYAGEIETVKNDYRNPAAHTNELTKIDAEQCFNLVLDVEKLLKRMLDEFSK